MYPLLNGIYWGLFLTILVGPIIFILIQASIERGFWAGVTIGLGMWTSDLMFILLTTFGLSYLEQVTQWPAFELILGCFGGAMLIAIGIFTMTGTPSNVQMKSGISGDYTALWLKGFLINTVNPFNVFFWLIITTTVVAENYVDENEPTWFFLGIMGTIIITDVIKVLLAKALKRWLTPGHIVLVRRMTGGLLIGFGLVLIVRVLL